MNFVCEIKVRRLVAAAAPPSCVPSVATTLDMADMAQPPQQGVLKAQEAQNEQTFTANMMDLRLQLLSMRADYLNQLNTQATLVGGAAIGLLSSGELTAVNELHAEGKFEHYVDADDKYVVWRSSCCVLNALFLYLRTCSLWGNI